MVKAFRDLMSDADMSDWAWLSQFDDLARGVYIYDHSAKSVDHPVNLDWPITWFYQGLTRSLEFVRKSCLTSK